MTINICRTFLTFVFCWFKQYFIQHFSHIHSIIKYGTGFDKKLRAYVNLCKSSPENYIAA